MGNGVRLGNTEGHIMKKIIDLEQKVNAILGGCYTPPSGSADLLYFNVVGVAGSSTITDRRLIGWDVALIAVDGKYPRNTGFTKLRDSTTIRLTTPLSGSETITLFLYRASAGAPSTLPVTYFPYQFPIIWSIPSQFPYSLPILFN